MTSLPAIERGIAGLPLRAIVAASVAGVVIGVAYLFSPITTWVLILTPPFVWWACRGLSGRERVWVQRLLIAALGLRLLTLAGFFFFSDYFRPLIGAGPPGDPLVPMPFGVLFGDEWLIKQFSLVAMHIARGESVASQDIVNLAGNYAQSGFVYALAYFEILMGAAPYGVHVLNAALFVTGTAIMYRLVRSAYGALPAFVGFVIVLFMPSLFVWSISALKEAAYVFLTAVSISATERAVRSKRISGRIAAIAIVLLAIASIGTLRRPAIFMTAGGLILGLLARAATLRQRVAVAVALTLVVCGFYAATLPSVRQRVEAQISFAAGSHIGYVRSRGYSYKLLDDVFYTSPKYLNADVTLQPDEALRFVTRAAISFVVVPLPWRAQSRSMLALVPQQVVWYLLVVLAFAGVGSGFRRDALVTWLFIGVIVTGSAAVALTSGNVGTLVRMRDMVVPMVTWLGALGGCTVVEYAVGLAAIRPPAWSVHRVVG